MAIRDASIKKALVSQENLMKDREHCSMDPQMLAAVGCAVGQQVRIKRSNDEYGLYTVSEVHPENPESVVRAGLAGRQRLGTSAEFDGVLAGATSDHVGSRGEAHR